MIKHILVVLLLSVSALVQAQSIEQIKADNKTFLWGEGTGTTLSRADQEALLSLVSQISVRIESEFTVLKEEMQKSNKTNFSEQAKLVMNTYSNATLTNAERLISGEEPEITVFRFIKRTDLDKIFIERRDKILSLVSTAEKALDKGQIADALKCNSWALLLLRSHPEGNTLTYVNNLGEEQNLITYLPMLMNNILNSLTFSVTDITDEENARYVKLAIKSKGVPVTNFDFTFWDGTNWSPICAAQDGVGMLEFYGEGANTRTETRIKAEYIYESEMIIDREVEEVNKVIDPIPMRNAFFKLKIQKEPDVASTPVQVQVETVADKPSFESFDLTQPANPQLYVERVNEILNSLKTRNFKTVEPLFTSSGYEMFSKLLDYGKARLISTDGYKVVQFGETVVCRGPKMNFAFSNNTRSFVERVVFNFDKNGKVDYLNFGLDDVATASILKQTKWSEVERMTIINFLECYKTAYALKRLDYIESVFSDNALIIVGNVTKTKPDSDSPFKNNTKVVYNRYSKQQYISHLRHSFASKEFINISFEDSDIRKSDLTSHRYGIQIKQNYFSSNYGDEGYLFLLVDLETPDEPIIHVRTWQPKKNADGSIYGLGDF